MFLLVTSPSRRTQTWRVGLSLGLASARNRAVPEAQDGRGSNTDDPPDPVDTERVATAEKAPEPVPDECTGDPEQIVTMKP